MASQSPQSGPITSCASTAAGPRGVLASCYLLDWSLGGQLGVRGERTINLVSHMFLKFSCEEKDLANWTDVVMIISELCIFLPDSSNPDIGCSI